ncbi:MAG: AtpZ/AtpI family protein [Campylobacterales bacterium]|nr:AtpZ/AtpI family protein [Campylobacterales bacterium]
MSEENKEPKYKKTVEGLDQLSLGISIGVAILMGVGIGFGLKSLFNQTWLLWLGVFWGVGAAVNNIYKAYKKQKRELDELANDPRYSGMNKRGDD